MSLDDLAARAHTVKTREEFVDFVAFLARDLREHPQSWENGTLERFLEALSGFGRDMPGYYRRFWRMNPKKASWRVFADMLVAAARYE